MKHSVLEVPPAEVNAGTIIEGEKIIEEASKCILHYVNKMASGEVKVCAVQMNRIILFHGTKGSLQ